MSAFTPDQALRVSGVPFKEVEGQWHFVTCPYHDDSTELNDAKGRVNPENGAFKCFKCDTATNVIAMIAAKMSREKGVMVTAPQVRAQIEGVLGTKEPIPVAEIDGFHQALLKDGEYQKRLRDKHGIGFDEILRHKLGVKPAENNTSRITIPVYDFENSLVNVRCYSYHDHENKMIGWKRGYNKDALYLRENVQKGTEVYIAEGEFKAILLNAKGFNAVAPTGGAKRWNDEWNELFKQKDVVVVYDVDGAGRKGAAKLCQQLYGVASSVRDVFLRDVAEYVDPVNGKQNGDITDYFIKAGKTADDFRQLCLATAAYSPPKAPVDDPEDLTVYDVTLAESSNAKFHKKRVTTKVVVSAKDTSPFIIPKEAMIICNRDKEYCVNCHVSSNPYYKFPIKSDDQRIVQLVNTNEKAQQDVLRKIAEVYPGCKASSVKVLESTNVEELRLIPQISIGHSTSEMVARRVYAVAHGIDTNTCYQIESRVCVESDQHATLVCYKAEKAQDDIDAFTVSQDLTVFQPAEWSVEAVEAKLSDIHEDLSYNVTRIYERPDLHMFYDLVWHSVLYVPFQGKLVKGWLDALVIGDSGQGKSECSTRLISHYRSGERADSKRSSVAGLVGGLQESNGRWFASWGTIPLNDRRLVVLEEIKGMSTDALAAMTDMRSTGVAAIIKIERQQTNARTRLVWISNPRSAKHLSQYNYGIEAVSELVGAQEDVRRFDMAIAVSKDEVAIETINRGRQEHIPHFYTSDLCAHLVMWAWSRLENQVEISPEAENELLQAATRMGRKYSSSIPLVLAEDQRLKLLRLSTACAARTFSTVDGVTLRVLPCHVTVIERYLDRIYSDAALGYADYSLAAKSEDQIQDPRMIEDKLISMPNSRDTVKTLIESDSIDCQVVMDCSEWMKDQAQEFIGFLFRKGALRKQKRLGYRKTSAFIIMLKKLDRSGSLTNQTLASMKSEI